MKTLIILKKEEHLQNLSFNQITVLNNVPVQQTVNGLSLKSEFKNTINVKKLKYLHDQNIIK